MLPLQGISVLDLTQAMAGPMAGQILGDMGADVIKVEPMGGEHFRPQLGGAWVPSLNRNKRGLAVDLTSEGGKQVMWRLVQKADVFMEAFVPGVITKLGFGYPAVSAVNPGLVYLSISGYGQTGPYRGRGGYDPCIQAETGIMEATGDLDGPPARVGTAPIDQGTGTYGALGVAVALLARHRTGRGQHIDLALYDVGVQLMSHWITNYGRTGEDPRRMGMSHTLLVPLRTFATQTQPLYVACTQDAFWLKLLEAVGLSRLKSDPRFKTNTDRVANRAELEPLLEAAFAAETCETLLGRLIPAGVPCAPVKSVSDMLHDPHAIARQSFVAMDYPGLGKVMSANNPLRLSDSPVEVRRLGPQLGEHTREILREVGYRDGEIEALARSHAVRLHDGETVTS
ncbi:CaiB/BaiF CoA-transferase family protein [Reyranella sp. CPCC 100927]|uniref:CaiB/BaiF CoA transferase family protein n=1 Tax=Reyranella sp. CPCC 100927 TaxID=2599616 RepID=UPI0011B479D3|nr:CaiB/BaiF CoA-transferase family protein [Reyranella sp. CPCC 100927]TWS96358.1 CoA transferase [Reyranella sp. CPCC 100927]